ncbi:MAG TPA: helix-turn-helix domain-containing protein [Rhabdaerophilum sp.]|nr:helix-turn-helix domain-containing protein [Rhabdaerophilum sp.]
MTREDRGAPENCPVREVIAGISDKWSILVLLHLSHGDRRFSALKRLVPDISQRVLTVTLRGLERDGLVWRDVQPSVPPAVTYGLTKLGESLIGHFRALADWAKENRVGIDDARRQFDARTE